MTEKLQIAKAFLNYFLNAKNLKSETPLYIKNLYREVIASKKNYYIFDEVELLRKELLSNHSKIQVIDLGAGSKIDKTNTRKVSSIAKFALSNAKSGQMLFKLVEFARPKTILELGTSLGINTLYLASAAKNARVYTLEGCPNTLSIAKKNFRKAKISNITTIEGDINQELQPLLNKLTSLEMVYFDANHKKEPTIQYFTQCLPLAKKDSIFIFDDIYWSKEMMEAWQQITEHPVVTLSIDLFELGLIFFNDDFPKENLTLKF